MIVNKLYLVTRNARNKIQVVIAELSQNGNNFIINRTTGQYLGKFTEQPELVIEKGKAKRTIIQQAELEFNSIVKKYLDKGYKRLDSLTKKGFEELTASELDSLVSTLKNDANGNLKPMLAKRSEDCQSSIFNKPLWNSRKLDGVRCMFKLNENGDVVTVSRGGQDYNASTVKIAAELVDYFKENPTHILDGELYHHAMYLQTISGIARKKTWDERCNLLEYWIYDIALPDMEFEKDRLPILNHLREEVFKDSKKIKVLEHYKSNSWDDIQTLHDKWVEEGFEGLVARKPDKTYAYGQRGSSWIKCKQYKDDEFEIIDYKDGLRPEDFCFICKTKDGKVFSAQPIGDRELKAEYIKNIDNIIGCLGKVKFFNYSKDGIPTQTHFQCVRYKEDLD